MSNMLLVSQQTALWTPFLEKLKIDLGVDVETVHTGAEAMHFARETDPVAVIIDQHIPDVDGIDLVRQLMTINAMIHVACVSDLPKEAFHEASEGLGVLMQLSPNKDLSEASQLAVCLRQVSGLAS